MSTPLMRCPEARPYLSAYVDGELDDGLEERVHQHLISCAACSRTVARYQAVDELIGRLPAPGPSPEVLDQVLSATSSLNKVGAIRESLLRPEKPLAPRSLPAFFLADTNLAAPVRVRPSPGQSRRSWVLPRALPALAALLIITLTLISFHGRPGRISSILHPTPNVSPQSEVKITNRQVLELAQLPGLGFVPQLPTTLPEGARYESASVESTDSGQKFLEVQWSLPAPFTTLHLREMGVPLGKRTDYLLQESDAYQTWQLPDAPQWQTMVDRNDTGRLVIGEDRVQFSITLDIGLRGGDLYQISPNAGRALTDLRLTSLSIDRPYLQMDPISAPNSSMVVHFRMQTSGKSDGTPYQWDVYWDKSHGEGRASLYKSTVSGELGSLQYVDYLYGGEVSRCPSSGACETIPSTSKQVANDPFMVGNKVQTFFNNINADVRDAELWNLGGPQNGLAGLGVGTTALYALAFVSGPYPITVYVNAGSLQVAGVISQIDLAATNSPGGKNALSPLSSFSSCAVSYPLIVYVDAHSSDMPDLRAPSQSAGVGQPDIPTIVTCL